MGETGRWSVARLAGEALELHARVPGASAGPTVEVLEVAAPALVLGSTQPDTVVDAGACDAAGVAVVRRRSGGGVVLVGPGECVWVDVLVPAGDPRWVDDVSSSAWWLGATWVDALADVGVVGGAVHQGALCVNRWGRLVCFAGLGGGEVTLGEGGPKVVGIAQRRGRWGARFQCSVPLRWDAERLVALLAWPSAGERAEALSALADPGLVAPVEAALAGPLVDAFLARLAAR
jgi:lipoate-protein ligase A